MRCIRQTIVLFFKVETLTFLTMRISIIVMPMVLCKTGFVFKVLAFRFTDYGAVWIEKDNNGTRVIC